MGNQETDGDSANKNGKVSQVSQQHGDLTNPGDPGTHATCGFTPKKLGEKDGSSIADHSGV